MQNTVLIIGAGPTGLVLALWLTRLGIPVRIIDKDQGPGSTSRAMAVQARTLEFYQQIGLAQEIISRGIKVNSLTMRKAGNKVTSINIEEMGKGLSSFPYLLSFPQDEHEAVLIEHLSRAGVQVERLSELIEFSQNSESVTATIRANNKLETIQAAYICGCDGAHSTVRHQLGFDFPGGTYSQVFYVADTFATGDVTEGGVQICLSKTDFCLVFPIRTSGSVRLIGVVPQEHEQKEKLEFADVSASVFRNTSLKIEKVNWFASYHLHHRVAERFRKDRAFILGDAAHIHSPFGGQGMNTGIGDAVNLAWKLAAVLKGRAHSQILDTYESERIPFARLLVSTTDRLFNLAANRTPYGAFFRYFFMPHVMPLIFRFHFSRRLLFKTISQTRINYRGSALSQGQAEAVQGGDRLPWVNDETQNNFTPLQSLDWQIHVYGTASSALRTAAQSWHLALNEFPWSDLAKNAGLTQDAAYLLRPDGYISVIAAKQELAPLQDMLSTMGVISGGRS